MKTEKLFPIFITVLLLVSIFAFLVPQVHATSTLTLRPAANGTYQQFTPYGETATFGDTNIEASSNSFGGNVMYVSKAALSQAGTITKITAYVSGSSSNLVGALYSDVSGAATTLLAQSNPVSVTTLGWYDFVFVTSYSASTGNYWMGVLSNVGYAYRYAAGSGTSSYKSGLTYPTLPNPYSGGAPENNQQSIYGTYTPATAHWQSTSDQNDSTGVQVTASTTLQETELLATTAQTGTISSVEVHMRADSSTILLMAETLCLTHSTLYAGTPVTVLSTGFADYSTTYTTNPNTSAAWTWAEVNAIEVGAQPTTLPAGTIQFSEFYIIVNYATGGTQVSYSLSDGITASSIQKAGIERGFQPNDLAILTSIKNMGLEKAFTSSNTIILSSTSNLGLEKAFTYTNTAIFSSVLTSGIEKGFSATNIAALTSLVSSGLEKGFLITSSATFSSVNSIGKELAFKIIDATTLTEYLVTSIIPKALPLNLFYILSDGISTLEHWAGTAPPNLTNLFPIVGTTPDEALAVGIAFGMMGICLAIVMPIVFIRRRNNEQNQQKQNA